MRVLDDHKTLAIVAAVAAGGALAVWAVNRRRRSPSRPAGASPTSFEAFLKTPTDNPSLATPKTRQFAPTSFEAFLKNPDIGPGGVVPINAVAAAPPPPAVPRCPPSARPVVVLYGTEFGFSREIAEKLCEAIAAAHGGAFWPELLNMADLPSGLPLARCQALLVVCSTQGDGVPPTEAREFCSWLHGDGGAAAVAADGTGTKFHFTVAALGDRSYAHYAACGRAIDARLEEIGASRFLPRVDVNKEDWTAINAWIAAAVAALPSLGLATAAELGCAGVAADRADAAGASATAPIARKWTKSRPYYAKVVGVEGLCRVSGPGDKNTVRVEIDLGGSEIAYQPGDALGVWPTNDPEVVEDLLEAAGVDGSAPVSLPSWHYAGESGAAVAVVTAVESSTLREVMSVCYDLRSPKPDLLRLLATKLEALVPPNAAAAAAAGKKGAPGRHRSTDSDYSDDSAYSNDSAFDVVAQSAAERSAGTSDSGDSSAADLSSAVDASARLAALMASSEGTAAYLASRHVADVLRDWRPAALTSTELLGVLRALSPRLYSISSSPLETSPPGRTVQITVAVVRYESLGCRRGGVASTCLGERCTPGAKIPVYLYPNPEFRLPADPGTPIVMVGPGTGVAPFRAFLRHRSLLSSSPCAPKPGPAVLFFGSRRRDQDFLYGPELEGAAAAGEVELHTAFSRAGPAKVYVQHQIKENANRVWALLGAPGAQGVLYVCGDGAHMAADVEATIKEIASESLGGDSTAGEAWFKDLAAAGRVRKDTWTA